MSPEMSDRITTVTPETIFLDIYKKHLLLIKTFTIVQTSTICKFEQHNIVIKVSD